MREEGRGGRGKRSEMVRGGGRDEDRRGKKER